MFNYSSRQKDGEGDKPNEVNEEAGVREEDWRNGINLQEGHSITLVDGETGESIPEEVAMLLLLLLLFIVVVVVVELLSFLFLDLGK